MIRLRRRLLIDTALLGVGLTLLVVLADQGGMLTSLENWAYDRRAASCQRFSRPPTAQLVHLDIDDRALDRDGVGEWPWPRRRFAEIIDELAVAGPKAVALDITFPGAQPDDNDAIFAASLHRLDRAIVPVDLSLENRTKMPPVVRAIHDELAADPALDKSELAKRVEAKGGGACVVSDDLFFPARRRAVFERILAMSQSSQPPLAEVRAKLLPAGSSETDINSPISRIVNDQYTEVMATLAVGRLAASKPVGMPPVTSVPDLLAPPLTPFSKAAVSTGFVSVGFFQDGAVRSLPLVVQVGDRLFTQFGLALACRMLDVEPASLRYTERSVILPRPGMPDLIIPTHPQWSTKVDSAINQVLDIPWFGTANWGTMYDYPKHVDTAQHVPIGLLWDVRETRRRIARHNAAMDDALIAVSSVVYSDGREAKYAANRPPPEDAAARIPLVEKSIPDSKDMLELVQSSDPKDLGAREKTFIASVKALPTMLEQAKLLQTQLVEQRSSLAKLLGGKAVLIGWTATGAIADFVPTSLHAKCPGVVVHGAIFNAIMTQHFWHRAPAWVTVLVTVLLGLASAFAASVLTPGRAAAVASFLLVGYLVVNGVILFDYAGIILGISPPIVAIAVTWAGCTLVRIIVEGKERALITRRFSNYADPALVDYLVEHPEQARFEGQVRELTVVFTDLQGFTGIAEKLGEKSVQLLNEYLGVMVPIIRRNSGYVNKFLGDGIMFFFGAPKGNEAHAAAALKTVLEMQKAMTPFNEKLAAAGLPALIMRAGVSTGDMVVGDAGSLDPERSDYTVLGDPVNLGSRLESGNKAVGTRMLANGRAKELGGKGVLLRPIGSFCYLGKVEGTATYEIVCHETEATSDMRQLAEQTEKMVGEFAACRFDECLFALDVIEVQFGSTKLTQTYRELCDKYRVEGPPSEFCGNIVLSEK